MSENKANFLTFKDKNPKGLYVVTGEIGTGKSVFCREMLLSAKEAGMKCGGILSPGVFDRSVKVKLLLHDIGKDEKKAFAEKVSLNGQACSDLRLGQWCISTKVLAWGNSVLGSLDENLDVVFVDELGPLEFRKNMGLINGIDVLKEKKYDYIFAVIRPSLMDEAKSLFDIQGVINL